ncbi:MAG: hypothetical protein HY796_08170 [Elusimicrobia bacterium]|nr:hypothetical protein [Elusimicrobiota bacterium]
MPILGHQTIGLHQPEEKFLMNAFKLEGTSMLPLFKPGEVVIVQPFSLQLSAFLRATAPFITTRAAPCCTGSWERKKKAPGFPTTPGSWLRISSPGGG